MCYKFEAMSQKNTKIQNKKRKPLAYKLRDASELLSVPVSTLRKRIRQGDIEVVTGFGPWLITTEEIDRLLKITLRGRKGGE